MYCPVCKDKELVMTERQSVEIDYCQSCRGVWLDRGELDKIIEKSSLELAAANTPPPTSRQPTYQSDHHGHLQYGDNRHRYKRKDSFWKELFD